ncbi:MAG: hypothetical protein HXL10_00525 [Candidatus Nanosynbacter sp.]|nr:hypothetical protein [Candidatus Nanosynbacter sp.]
MNLTLIAVMIVVVTFAILYGESARKTKSNQEVLALQKSFLRGCLVSLVLLLLPVFESLAFPKPQPHLATVTFIVESALIALFGFLELRKLNYRKVKLFCLLALHVGIALVWWQLFSYYQMEQGIFNSPSFTLVPFMVWAAAIVVVAFTYLDGPKLRAKKKSKAEAENAKLREQIERMQNERNRLQEDNKKLRNAIQSGTIKSKSVTEDKKAEQNPPKNTQTDEDLTPQVEEATTTSAPKSDAEDTKVKVTNSSMNGIEQQKLSEILDRLDSDSSPEAQQAAIQELVKSYRTAAIKKAVEEFAKGRRAATAKEATTPEEETSSQEPEFVDFEEESEEEEEVLDHVDSDDGEDDTIFAGLSAKISPATVALTAAIILVIYVTVLVLA